MRLVTGIPTPPNALALDAGCGLGRNAIALAACGWNVVCADRDANRLRQLEVTKHRTLCSIRKPGIDPGELICVCVDLENQRWPFAEGVFHLIVGVHFVKPSLFPRFAASLRHGGHAYFETFGGHGDNGLALPKPGVLRRELRRQFCLIRYQEKIASVRHPNTVSVKALAQRL